MGRMRWGIIGVGLAASVAAGCSASVTSTNQASGVGTVTLSPTDTTIVVGQHVHLAVIVRDTANVIVQATPDWSTSNHAVATVSGGTDANGQAIGVVTAVTPGVATIVAAVQGIQGSARVTVVSGTP